MLPPFILRSEPPISKCSLCTLYMYFIFPQNCINVELFETQVGFDNSRASNCSNLGWQYSHLANKRRAMINFYITTKRIYVKVTTWNWLLTQFPIIWWLNHVSTATIKPYMSRLGPRKNNRGGTFIRQVRVQSSSFYAEGKGCHSLSIILSRFTITLVTPFHFNFYKLKMYFKKNHICILICRPVFKQRIVLP